MATSDILISMGLFVVQLAVAVYLIRYSNQQLMKSISDLRDKNLELMKLNARLTRTVITNEKSMRDEMDKVHVHTSTKTTAKSENVAVPVRAK